MAVKNEMLILAGIVLGAIFLMQTDFFGKLYSVEGGVGGGAGTTKVEISNPDKACGSTTLTMDFQDIYSASTDMSSYNGTVFIDGKKQGVVSEGSTFTANGGKELNVYYALEDAGNNYYASHASGKIPCTGQTASFLTSDILSGGSLAGALQKDAPEKLYRSQTASSISVYNKKSMASNPSTAISIGAGGTETARIYIDWSYEEGYGVVDGNTLACRFTDSQIDQSELIASLDGVALGTAKYVPSGTKFSVNAANESTKFWAFPAIDAKITTSSTLDLSIKGDDTNPPTETTNMSCEILDTDLFETDDGAIKIGVEDSDDNSNVGRATEQLINILLG